MTNTAAVRIARKPLILGVGPTDAEIRDLVAAWTAAHMAWVVSPIGSTSAVARHAEREVITVAAWRAGIRISRGNLPE